MSFRLLLVPALLIGANSVAADGTVDFNRDIRPILSNNCFQCHGPDEQERKAELRLDTAAGIVADLGGHAAVIPGDPAKSALWERVTATDPDVLMPPPATGKKLTAKDRELLQRWIQQGAKYSRHWSYEPPVRPELPMIADAAWPRTPIDRFILARLDKEGLKPQPEADRYALARRVSLDLTGLPPTVAEADEFVNDASPDAYARYVDRLLQKETYGEHWARLWLDLARYADSAGYADDPARTIWAYRDYVIRTYNRNLPFDQFSIEQIAGDLLPEPSEDQLIATAFHRNTLTNNEGGTNDEEFRNVAVVDRVNTTLAVWMGTTISCAQCHTHKFDPLSQTEFFQLFAILNQTEDADRTNETPLHELWDPEVRHQKTNADAELAALLAQPNDPPSAVVAIQTARLQQRLTGLKPITTVPIQRDLAADKLRKTQLQHRGNFEDLGPEVGPGVPAAFHPLPEGQPTNRLALAKWLVDRRNPLTARVMVNRLWEQLFGIGLVATSEEFGSQGEPSSHPELLDWLAVEFMDSGWNQQHLLKLLVTSAAYRQTSHVTPELYQRDPDNRLLARGPRFRMSAEMIRDQALAVSGLLSPKLYGPPVRPLQPKMGVNAAFGSAVDWQTSDGEDRYRRGMYTTWRRSNPYPSMAAFDAPNREVCTLRRTRTNTPLQALVTLNDPVYVEAAQTLAKRTIAVEGTTADRAAFAFRTVLIRPPTADETARLAALWDRARSHLATNPIQAAKLAASSKDATTDVTDLAAWTVVCNSLMNLDEMFMPR
ncbi:MAG: PSD1 and planctomycete cytochrome C domain-containing protein [Planctomycetaceae bacterium]|nr:PSD1 and planctomycete cytochrome C domain-containing protein [Planctomycetaceae bacterium]